jgi:DNA invertase Pin-like site-specific DNA recombinase
MRLLPVHEQHRNVENNMTTKNGILRVALYARVSTEDQSCRLQLKELRDYCLARQWQVSEEYIDHGWSGNKASRPQLDKLLRAARSRKVDCIVVWKLDRWGRSTLDCLSTIRELTDLGVRFIVMTQGIDTDEKNPMGRFFTSVLAAVGELEREMIRERVIAGLKAARAAGKDLGRPKKVFDRHKALELRAAGVTWRAIGAQLGIPFTTVRDACRVSGSNRTETEKPA